jgi:hypothetical protein
MLWIISVLSAASGLRTASRMMEVVMPFFNFSGPVPSWYAGRFWLMRLGYYKLTRPKEQANDWIWIIDHSIQLSTEKCLVILGIRLCNLPIGRSLIFSDVEPIELIPVIKSNGDIVYEQLKIAKKKTGIPREIIADHGSDIKVGIEKFCNEHKETCYIYDIKHALSIALKRELENDEDWEKLVTLSAKTKREICQTGLASLTPPNQRKKSRYMNADTLLNWAEKLRIFLNEDDKKIGQYYDAKKIREKFYWIVDLTPKLVEWSNLIMVIKFIEDFIRKNGLNINVYLELKKQLNEFNLDVRAMKFSKDAISFVEKGALKAKPGERLLGSSEIIESLFGKQKAIEKEQSRSGFTGLLLVLPALISETSEAIIKKALEATPTKCVVEWYQKNIIQSVQAKRVETFKLINKKEQKQNQYAGVV